MKLYRYRPLSEMLFKELLYSEIYFASPIELNDSLDLNGQLDFFSENVAEIKAPASPEPLLSFNVSSNRFNIENGSNMKGRIFEIYVAPTASDQMISVTEANLVAGRGIKGDRYYNESGTFSEMLRGKPLVELTLIERECIEWFNSELGQLHGCGDFRRSIVTESIRLNDLVGERFYIGDAEVVGIKLCEPCPHLAETVNPLVLPHLIGKGGLRAQIIKGATVKKGDWLGIS